MRSWKTLVVAVVTIPAVAYVVGETVAEDPPTTRRAAVVLSDAVNAAGRDDDGDSTEDDRARDDREVTPVRSCAGALGDHDADDRTGPADDGNDDGDGEDDGDDGDDGDDDGD